MMVRMAKVVQHVIATYSLTFSDCNSLHFPLWGGLCMCPALDKWSKSKHNYDFMKLECVDKQYCTSITTGCMCLVEA